jgi:hypothetical protein
MTLTVGAVLDLLEGSDRGDHVEINIHGGPRAVGVAGVLGSLRLRELRQLDLARGWDWLEPLRSSLERSAMGAGRVVARRHAQD